MNQSLRLLPMTMLMAFLLLGLKIGEVMRDGRRLALSFSEAQAESAPAPTNAKEGDKPADKPVDSAAKDSAAKDSAAPKEGEPKVNPPSTKSDESADDQPPPKHEYSQVEIDLLQSLAKRRAELDDWAKQVQLKENMLVATEQRINGKIDSLEKVKKQVEDLLAQYNEQEDTKIRSLVKIYENMKPKDAARIFEELDMPVLLMVVDRMSERKVAPVLAAMSPTKAKDVTVQLAEQRKLQKSRVSNTPPPPAPDATSTPATSDAPSADNSAASPAVNGGSASGKANATPPTSSPPAASSTSAPAASGSR